jgi:hypothetical protein
MHQTRRNPADVSFREFRQLLGMAEMGAIRTFEERAVSVRKPSISDPQRAWFRAVCLVRDDWVWPTAVRLFSEPTIGKADLQMRDDKVPYR